MKLKMCTLFVIVFSVAVVAAGCGRLEAYGTKLSDGAVTSPKDILLEPEKYDGKTVVVEGKILNECPSGCWFDLKDGGAVLHVDIKPAGLAIPQKVGHEVKVQGDVVVHNKKPELLGKGVEIR
jgi:RNase P/RNase MRP subunit p29